MARGNGEDTGYQSHAGHTGPRWLESPHCGRVEASLIAAVYSPTLQPESRVAPSSSKSEETSGTQRQNAMQIGLFGVCMRGRREAGIGWDCSLLGEG